jgi:hypothetical protein
MPEPDIAEKNRQSWQGMVASYEHFLMIPSWEWLEPLLQLVKHIEDTQWAHKYLAGLSLYHLIIPTAQEYGLQEGEPFVAVRLEREGTVQIEYWNETHGSIIESQSCSRDKESILVALTPLMNRLWEETKGEEMA